jgi:flagella synthesis protein FlgN
MPATSPMSSLREELNLMTELLDLMRQEQHHLIGADIDSLGGVTARKSELVGQLSALATTRHAALAAAGFEAREEGMRAWLAAGGADGADALWDELLQQTRAAKEANRVNGLLINRHLAHTRGALNALRPPAQGGNTYGPSGQTTSSPTSRRLIIG